MVPLTFIKGIIGRINRQKGNSRKLAKLKDVKIPEDVHTRLTKFKGELTTATGKNISYGDTINYLLDNQKEKPK